MLDPTNGMKITDKDLPGTAAKAPAHGPLVALPAMRQDKSHAESQATLAEDSIPSYVG